MNLLSLPLPGAISKLRFSERNPLAELVAKYPPTKKGLMRAELRLHVGCGMDPEDVANLIARWADVKGMKLDRLSLSEREKRVEACLFPGRHSGQAA